MSASKKKNTRLELVKAKSNLKKVEKLNSIYCELQELVNELGNIDNLVDDPSVIIHICELVENVNTYELTGAEKQELAIKLLVGKFPVLNNEKDIKRIKLLIDSFCENKVIQKIADSKVASKSFWKFIVRKFL